MPRRSTNIYKRKDGRWEARYVSSIGIDGKKKYASVYAKTYAEVKEKQCKCIQTSQITTRKEISLTLEELMWEWLGTTVNSVKRSTYQKYESIIRNHIAHGIGEVPLKLLSSQMLDQYTHDKMNGSDKLSPKTVNDILVIINSALSYAVQEYGVSKPKIRRAKELRSEMRVLSVEEQHILVNFLLNEMDLFKLGVLISLFTGIRIGELCALQWEDIKSDRLIVNKSFQRIKVGNTTQLVQSSPKTASSVRVIPLPESICAYLEPFRSTGPVLKTRNGNQVEPRLMQIKFSKYIQQCELEKTNFHALRHTFATRCIEAGFDIKTLSEILGHADVKTTLNRYVHSSYELKQASMDRLSITI